MISKWQFNVFITSLFILSLAGPSWSQEAIKKEEPKPPQIVKVFRLETASSEMAAQVLQTMVEGSDFRIAIDSRSNGLIVAGSEEQLKVVEAILLKLDEGKEKAMPTIMQLKYVPAEEAMKIISKQFQKTEDLKVAADPRQNMILITATKSVMEKVAEFVRAIDRPVTKGQLVNKNVLIYTYWIVDQEAIKDAHPEWKLRDIPQSIQTLVKDKLAKRTNIKKPMMAANLAIQAAVGDATSKSSAIQNGGNGKIDRNHTYEIEMQGTLRNGPDSGAKIEFDLQMLIALRDQNRSVGNSTIQTKISTPLNHPVCLGVTPVNGMDSILIVEIVEAD